MSTKLPLVVFLCSYNIEIDTHIMILLIFVSSLFISIKLIRPWLTSDIKHFNFCFVCVCVCVYTLYMCLCVYITYVCVCIHYICVCVYTLHMYVCVFWHWTATPFHWKSHYNLFLNFETLVSIDEWSLLNKIWTLISVFVYCFISDGFPSLFYHYFIIEILKLE